MRNSVAAVLCFFAVIAVRDAHANGEGTELGRVVVCGLKSSSVPVTVTVNGAAIHTNICVPRRLDLLDQFRGDQQFIGQQTRLFRDARDSETQASTEQVCRTNPIDIASGLKIETEDDFTTSGEFPLELTRKYKSVHGIHSSIFGESWTTNFTYSLEFPGDSLTGLPKCEAVPGAAECADTSGRTYFVAIGSDGRGVSYTQGADGIFWEQKTTPISKAVREVDGTWTVYDADRSIKRYTKGGYLKEWKNQQGIGWTFTYGGRNGTQLQVITHTSGRNMQFLWTGDALTQIKDPAGNVYEYTYIDAGQIGTYGVERYFLKSVKFPGTPTTVVTYSYTNESDTGNFGLGLRLSGKSFNGIRYSTFGYDANLKANSSEHAGGIERSTFVYSTSSGAHTVVETNPLGKQTTFTFNGTNDLTLVQGGASTNCAATSKGATYDGYGNLDAETDFNNNVTDYTYATNGQLQKKVEALGTPEQRTTLYVWDPADNRLLTETVAGDHETSYEYSADQRLKKISLKNISAAISASQGQVRATTFNYTQYPNGMIATLVMDGPLPNDTITSTYNTFGDLTQVENGLGHVTLFGGYDAMGRPGYTVTPNGSRTDFTYDARGRLLTASHVVNGATQTATNTYDGFGRLVRVTLPDGQYRAYQYDVAGRVLYEWEPEAGGTFAEKVFTYNAMSLPTSIKIRRVSVEPTQGTVQ